MNNKNLIPFNKMTTERHKEISRLGGLASGVERRKNRDFKIFAYEYLFRANIIDEELEEYEKWKRSKARKDYLKRTENKPWMKQRENQTS